jgi:hypothetical protein
MDEPEIEKHVLGRRPYHHPLAVDQDDGRTFQIVPRRLPIVGYICYIGVMCLFAGGISWILAEYSKRHNEPWKHALLWACCICIGLLVTTILGLLQVSEIKRGPWLIYDRALQTIRLPRLGESFARGELLQLQNVTGYLAVELESSEPQQHSELILVTCRNGQVQRWTIMASQATHLAYSKFLDPLAEALDLPVVRIKQRKDGTFEASDYLPKSRRL